MNVCVCIYIYVYMYVHIYIYTCNINIYIWEMQYMKRIAKSRDNHTIAVTKVTHSQR